MTTKPLCWVPYYTAEVSYKATKPCCKFNYSSTLPYPNIKDFNSDSANQWRTDSFMGDSLKEQCSACQVPEDVYSYETANRTDFKQRGWAPPQQAQLRKLIIGMDNICASSCIQCGPHFSTTLDKLARASDNWQRVLGKEYQLPGLQQFNIADLDGLVGDLEIVHLYGGEPLFSPNLLTLLELLAAQSPKLHTISISTGLRKIKESHIAALAALKIKVMINISMDGPVELNSWIRGISSEEFFDALDIIDRYRPWVKIIGFQTTIATYNIFAIDEYLADADRIFQRYRIKLPQFKTPNIMSTIIINPNGLHPRQLPDDIKAAVGSKLEAALARAPQHAHELVRTSLYALSLPQTQSWEMALNRVNAYAKWRGDTTTWQDWYNKYML